MHRCIRLTLSFLTPLAILLSSQGSAIAYDGAGYQAPPANYYQPTPGYGGGYAPQQNYGNRGPGYNDSGFSGPWGGNGPSFSGPWNNRGSGFSGPWNNRGSGFSGPWNNRGSGFSGPWNNRGSGFSGPWDNRGNWGDFNNPFQHRGPGSWMDPSKGNMSRNWDDMLNAPSRMGRMPGGWEAPSVSVPNPIDVGDEFSDAARDMPDQMDNFRSNY